jgi:outer membrane receptor for ferrienterochelin and colicins
MRSVGLAVVIGLLLSSGAGAAPKRDRALEQAKQHFDEGQTLFAAGSYTEAAAAFQKAYDNKPFAAFLFNIAVCHERKGDLPRALELFQRYLDADPKGTDRAVVVARMEALRRQLAAPASSQPSSQPAAPELPKLQVKGVVAIVSEPPGASIYLDNKQHSAFARTPYLGPLPAGRHTIIIELRKYKPRERTESINPEHFYTFSFDLAPDYHNGWVEVSTNAPGADVYFDDRTRSRGRTPYSGFLPPGQHTLYLERRGYQPVSKVVQIAVGEARELSLPMEKVPFGWLRVTGETTRGAKVLVDGKPIACGTPCQAELAPGQYNIEVRRKGFKSYKERLRVQQAAETQFLVRLMPAPPRTKAYVSFGMSGAFLIGGIVCAALSQTRADQVQLTTPGRPVDSGDSRFFTGRVLAITADSLFALAAISGGLGFYYMFRNEGPDSYGETRDHKVADSTTPSAARTRVTVLPSVGPGGIGVAGTVRF